MRCNWGLIVEVSNILCNLFLNEVTFTLTFLFASATRVRHHQIECCSTGEVPKGQQNVCWSSAIAAEIIPTFSLSGARRVL